MGNHCRGRDGGNVPGGFGFALLACQPVGPNAKRLVSLTASYGDVEFGTIVDNKLVVVQLAKEAAQRDVQLTVLINTDS